MVVNIASNTQIAGESTLEELFAGSLTDIPCVNIDSDREVWVGTLMCAQYLESSVDSIVVRGDDYRPVGIVGGYDLLDHLRKNPTKDSQYRTRVKEVMFTDIPKIQKGTKLRDLVSYWQGTKRAFAIIANEYGDYSPVSARRMLEVGTKCENDISISSMPRKTVVTIHGDEPLGKILDLMYENKTRKLLLEGSNRYISDRLILGSVARMLQTDAVDSFLDVPAGELETEEVTVIEEDLKFNRLCSVMNRMEHPYVIYKDMVVTPWDVCVALLSEELRFPLEIAGQKQVKEQESKRAVCPHCGMPLD